MVRKIAPACALCGMMSLLTACAGAPDTPTGPSSAVQTPPAPMTGIVQGLVRSEGYFRVREAPISGAQVLVTEGPGAGQSVTTSADGAYRLELPPGPFRLRWSAQGFEPRESGPGAVTAGGTTTVSTAILRQTFEGNPEWSVSGTVRDGLGNPVADAYIDIWDGVAWFAGRAWTDATGRFGITSRRPHPVWLHLSPVKEGYRTQHITVFCGPSCAITTDLRVLRPIREWLEAPSTMKVGDTAPVTRVVEYDDGTRNAFGSVRVESSNLGVIKVLPPLQPPYQTYVNAIAPGTATLQTQLSTSQPLTVNGRVVP